MYSDLCHAQNQNNIVHQEREKLMRDLNVSVCDLANKDQ